MHRDPGHYLTRRASRLQYLDLVARETSVGVTEMIGTGLIAAPTANVRTPLTPRPIAPQSFMNQPRTSASWSM